MVCNISQPVLSQNMKHLLHLQFAWKLKLSTLLLLTYHTFTTLYPSYLPTPPLPTSYRPISTPPLQIDIVISFAFNEDIFPDTIGTCLRWIITLLCNRKQSPLKITIEIMEPIIELLL